MRSQLYVMSVTPGISNIQLIVDPVCDMFTLALFPSQARLRAPASLDGKTNILGQWVRISWLFLQFSDKMAILDFAWFAALDGVATIFSYLDI